MVGERGREVGEFIQRTLGVEGLKKSVVVVATSDKPAAQRLSAAWTATSIANNSATRDTTCCCSSTVSRVSRWLSVNSDSPPVNPRPHAVTHRVFFNMLPQLVERAGRTEKGSITAFYTVLVEGDDNNEPIADTVRVCSTGTSF